MLVSLDSNDGRPLYLQIMDEVRRAISVGALRAEDPLPSVRELAGELVVNPRTVLQAYQELVREGVVYVRRGQGTFVSPGPPRSEQQRGVAREVAKRAVLEARRNRLTVEELLTMIQEVAAEEAESSLSSDEEEGGAR